MSAAEQRTVLECIGGALWDPTPTDRSDLRARQLAAALGYPLSFRVVRTVEESWNAEGKRQPCIVDRIHAGKPGSGCDVWYHHEGAMQAVAESWVDEHDADAVGVGGDDPAAAAADREPSTPFSFNGGHLLPRLPLYSKGDKVQVDYDGEWWDASILRRKESPDGFRYQVHYPADGSKQSNVEEELIRRRPEAADPKKVAASLGFGDGTEGWEAFPVGKDRWRIVAPDGTKFNGKKKALEYYEEKLAELGDPPWRTTGSEYLERRMVWTIEHKPSSRRTVKIEQLGTVVGWISETDVDLAGEPGFVSDRTGKPARLYHVEFRDDPHHQYASLLVQSQDLEEYELLECLLPEEEGKVREPPKKKART